MSMSVIFDKSFDIFFREVYCNVLELFLIYLESFRDLKLSMSLYFLQSNFDICSSFCANVRFEAQYAIGTRLFCALFHIM